MKHYPKVLLEFETIQRALEGASLSRFGDGELRLALGGSAVSQKADLDLQGELQAIMRGPSKALCCIPRLHAGGHKDWPLKYAVDKFLKLYGEEQDYGSSFVTRPDNAPCIGNPEYFQLVRQLWKAKDVTLVLGTDHGSLTTKELHDARSVDVIYGPRRDAYSDIASIEERIIGSNPRGPIIMCLGACATALAERLAKKGYQALDLGHIGRFMKRYEPDTKAPQDGPLQSDNSSPVGRGVNAIPRGIGTPGR